MDAIQTNSLRRHPEERKRARDVLAAGKRKKKAVCVFSLVCVRENIVQEKMGAATVVDDVDGLVKEVDMTKTGKNLTAFERKLIQARRSGPKGSVRANASVANGGDVGFVKAETSVTSIDSATRPKRKVSNTTASKALSSAPSQQQTLQLHKRNDEVDTGGKAADGALSLHEAMGVDASLQVSSSMPQLPLPRPPPLRPHASELPTTTTSLPNEEASARMLSACNSGASLSSIGIMSATGASKPIAPTVHGLQRPGTANRAAPRAGRPKFPSAAPPPAVVINQAVAAATLADARSKVGQAPPLPPSRGGRSTPSIVGAASCDGAALVAVDKESGGAGPGCASDAILQSTTGAAAAAAAAAASPSDAAARSNAGDDVAGTTTSGEVTHTGNRSRESIFEDARNSTARRLNTLGQASQNALRNTGGPSSSSSSAELSALHARQESISLYNATVSALMQKMYQKGKFAVLQYFTALDGDGSGRLSRADFQKALGLFCLAQQVTDDVVGMLIDEVEPGKSSEDEEGKGRGGAGGDDDGRSSCASSTVSRSSCSKVPMKKKETRKSGDEKGINYRSFCEALRSGTISYHDAMIPPPCFAAVDADARDQNGDGGRGTGRRRQGPDPERPFGDARASLPFGLMRDAQANLKSYDRGVTRLLETIRATFERHDRGEEKGRLGLNEFRAALREMDDMRGLNLSEEEMSTLFNDAAVDGRVEYGALLREKELPEFVKPKSLRRSQSGHPWRWDG